jgi:hypothetical protein
MSIRLNTAVFLAGILTACGDGGSGPDLDDDAARIAAEFDALADSIGANGHEPTADALRHAADLVRLTGAATAVSLTIDGESRGFLAVAEQLDFPIVVCSWPGDSGSAGGGAGGGGADPASPPEMDECTESGTHSMRTLIAWEPNQMAEVVRIVTDTGTTPAQEDVPDVMTGLPAYGSDSSVAGPPVSTPGFSGEYIVRDVGSWWVRQGNQSNAVEQEGGACTESRVTFGWAELACGAAVFRFEFAMDVEPASWEHSATGERSPSEASGSHELAMASTAVPGVRLRVLAWTSPEPEPLPPRAPIDSITTQALDVSFDASRAGGEVVMRFRVANPTDEAVTFEFPSGQRYDFTAVDPSGQVLWSWSADKAFTAAFEYTTLGPGEAMEFEERWSPEGVGGSVALTAELTSSNLPVVRTIELEL